MTAIRNHKVAFMDLLQAEPNQVLRSWLSEAEKREPNDPNAASLATSDVSGRPSVRMVLVKGIDDHGLRFFTNIHSRKGRELSANPFAAMCFHWKTLRRQVRVEGGVQALERNEVEQYFHTRSRDRQIAASVSSQSMPLDSRASLEFAFQAYRDKLRDSSVPLPDVWGGFLLVPNAYEFWSDGKNRLHDRAQFRLVNETWQSTLLYP